MVPVPYSGVPYLGSDGPLSFELLLQFLNASLKREESSHEFQWNGKKIKDEI